MHCFFWRHYAQGVMVWELLSVYLQGQYTLHKIRFLVFPNIRNTHFDQKNLNSYNTNCCNAFEKIIQRFRSKRLHHYMYWYWYGVRVTIDSFYNTGTIVHVHLYPI